MNRILNGVNFSDCNLILNSVFFHLIHHWGHTCLSPYAE
ncbi:hypothetical protein LEP1GSC038_3539 [Leptospira weilii str. 2006001855]|uniref:Uncharacterized protein n=1 Tax=Leptospira weilii str. 2006001855 TaxID=996804 RepID=M6G1P0_9LEPT|nr:hypothetical protein LEP1GSC038_3539 [Leptospira weilii str. 2006001855]